MAMQGTLQDMAVADLIQHNCQDRKTAQLVIEHNGYQASLFFREGAVVHATLDHPHDTNSLQGEEVIYRILDWQDGQFNLKLGLEPPAVTITRSWSGLLLEGARRLDEANHSSIFNQEKLPMSTKKKSELLADTLAELLTESSDIEGAAVVGTDGLVYSANVPQRALDENMVGAAAAAILGLSKRSADQLKRGTFNQTLIQGEDGNIIVASLDSQALFVGLTPKNVNLGMAFAEVRTMTESLRTIL
jgi:predicted regulator of Ras-like GTPase activity (Roadblock/LC7/MglB family)